MDMVNTSKRVSVAFIPDYVVKTLESRGMTLLMLDGMIGTYKKNMDPNYWKSGSSVSVRDIDNGILDTFRKWIDANISKNDIKDIMIANSVLNKLLYTDNYHSFDGGNDRKFGTELIFCSELYGVVSSSSTKDEEADFISLYSNPEIDINTIIMSRDKNVENTLWSTVVTENTIFIVLHSGFTNFMTYNNLEFRKHFASCVLDYIVKYFNEDTAVKGRVFKSFIRLFKK